MGNSYSIYRFSYHILSDSTILPINHQRNIMQHYHHLPLSIYIPFCSFLPTPCFYFVIINDLMLLKLNDFIVILPMYLSLSLSHLYHFSSSSCCTSCIGFFFSIVCFPSLMLLWHTLLKWFSLFHLLHIFLYARHYLGWLSSNNTCIAGFFSLCGMPVWFAMDWSCLLLLFSSAYHVKFLVIFQVL